MNLLLAASMTFAVPLINWKAPERVFLIQQINQQNTAGLLLALQQQVEKDNTACVADDSACGAVYNFIIHSTGGEVNAAQPIIDVLNAASSMGVVIRCYVPAYAISAGFQIFIHCPEKYAVKTAQFLWHRIRVVAPALGTAPIFQRLGEEMERTDQEWAKAGSSRLGISMNKWIEHRDAETLHTAIGLQTIAPHMNLTLTDKIPGLTTQEPKKGPN